MSWPHQLTATEVSEGALSPVTLKTLWLAPLPHALVAASCRSKPSSQEAAVEKDDAHRSLW